MRGFLAAVFFIAIGVAGYRYFVQPYLTADDGPAVVHGDPGAGDAPGSGGPTDPDPLVPAELGEQQRLAEEIDRHPGAESDPERLRLGEIKLTRDSASEAQEGEQILRALFERDRAEGPAAALLLVRHGLSDDSQLAGARYLIDRGPDTHGYLESLVLKGRRKLARREDSEQVEAWRLLSEAYFGSDDPEWRASIRPELDQLVEDLVLSPRLTRAFPSYTVQAGDTLARIARNHGTTVAALQSINRIEGDRIHPGNRLKIIKGMITLEVIKHDFRLDGSIDDCYLFSAEVGIGKFGKTPEGEFVIDIKQEKPAWQKKGQAPIPYGHPDNLLGEFWLGFKDDDQQSGNGIHGTSDPNTIGTEVSEGCIRMHNDDLSRLYGIVPLGTRVLIRE